VLAAVLFTVVGVAGQLGLTRVLTDLLPSGSNPACRMAESSATERSLVQADPA